MAKNSGVAILDIGSKTISTIIVDNNDDLVGIKKEAICEVNYSGFVNGAFCEPETLKQTITSLLKLAMARTITKPNVIYVGVPGEFTTAYCSKCSISLSSPKRIDANDVDALFDSEQKVKNHPKYRVIQRSPIYFELDDKKEKTLAPIGAVASKLGGLLSYILCEKTFMLAITKILTELGFSEIKFISSCFAESMALFETDVRDQTVALIDVGYITTSVTVVKTDGIIYMKSFSRGGAFIAMDLMNEFNIPYNVAEKLKDKLRLSLNVTNENVYEFVDNGTKYSFDAVKVHEVATNRIGEITEIVRGCLNSCKFDLPVDMPIFLTGGGISFIQGGAVVSRLMNREIDVVAPTLQQFGRPNLSSIYGLLLYAKKQQKVKKGFFSKFFK